MATKRQITEYLDIDLETEMWCCHRCGKELISARENYKRGCLVYERDPRTIYQPVIDGPYTFSPDPEWARIVEFYCPGCGKSKGSRGKKSSWSWTKATDYSVYQRIIHYNYIFCFYRIGYNHLNAAIF